MKKLIRFFQHPLLSVVTSFHLLFILAIIAVQFVGCNNEDVNLDETSFVTGECKFDEIDITLDHSSISLPAGETQTILVDVTVQSACEDFLCMISIEGSGIIIPTMDQPYIQVGCNNQECENNSGSCTFVVNSGGYTIPGTYTLVVNVEACNDTECSKSITGSAELEVIVTENSSLDFNILATPQLGVVQGFQTSVTTTIMRFFGHDLDIDLWVEDLPDKVNYTFFPDPVPGDEYTSQLTISAEYDAIPGIYYPILIKGSDDYIEKHAVFTLDVYEPYVVSLSSVSIEINQGQSGTLDLFTQALAIFTTPIMLSAEGDIIGQGIDVTFDPNPTNVNGLSGSTATINVENSVPTGEYVITILGTADPYEKSTILDITVVE